MPCSPWSARRRRAVDAVRLVTGLARALLAWIAGSAVACALLTGRLLRSAIPYRPWRRRRPPEPSRLFAVDAFGDYSEDEDENDNLGGGGGGGGGGRKESSRATAAGTGEASGGRLAAATELCSICFNEIDGREPRPGVLPCRHDGCVHTGCVWDWVCHLRDGGEADRPLYRISCPVCRDGRTARLVRYTGAGERTPVGRRSASR